MKPACMRGERDISSNSGDMVHQPNGDAFNVILLASHVPTATESTTITTTSTLIPAQPSQGRISFRSWYMSNYCNEDHVSIILQVQNCFPKLQWLITFYFKICSYTGEVGFYTAFIPLLAWLGMPFISLNMCVLMCIGQYVTGTMKDMAACPRPPCPPVEFRGNKSTATEYGYPSTHATQSVLFSYVIYELLRIFFPDYPVYCCLFCILLAINVTLSRLFLGVHWLADLVAGWGVGVMIVTSHVAFLKTHIVAVYELDDVMLWHYLLGFVILHIFAISHATPVDSCPCYLDSLRFLGATLGAVFGCWRYHTEYGVRSASFHPEDVLAVFSASLFLVQFPVCLFILLVGKEIISFGSLRILHFMFLQLSRGAPPNRPFLWRRISYLISHAVRCAYWIPRYGVSSINSGHEPCRKHYRQRPSSSTNGYCEYDRENSGCTVEISMAQHTSEADELMEGNVQLWSPRTHGHWWLWETQRSIISYLFVGFAATYICPVVLHVFF